MSDGLGGVLLFLGFKEVVEGLDLLDPEVAVVLMGDFAERVVGHIGLPGDIHPLAAVLSELLDNVFQHGLFLGLIGHKADLYSGMPILAIFGLGVKPQMISRIWQDRKMKKMSFEQVIADNLRGLMDRHSHLDSQPKVAKRSGVGQSTVGRVLRCSGSPSIETVSDIAEAFGLTLFDLINPSLLADRSGLIEVPFAAQLAPEERELLRIFKTVPSSGRHAILATAHREMETAGVKFKGAEGGDQRKVR